MNGQDSITVRVSQDVRVRVERELVVKEVGSLFGMPIFTVEVVETPVLEVYPIQVEVLQ